MSGPDVEGVFTTLFTAPANAVVQAEAEYRAIWAQWLENTMALLAKVPQGTDRSAILAKHLELAPVMKLGAQIEVGITLRVGSVTRREGSLGVSLGVGAFQASGSFGFMSQNTSESVMQARAAYALSNETEVTLKDFAANWSIDLADPTQLSSAIDFLKTPTPETPAPKLPENS
ncbi:hypothetical protein SCOR_21095 [Sulfidibacter corallicola]|uniref:Uncharacterized protein n=1 Tax=Sulfidibacter corallicola TaxID=2818388 RepID=A0A8A4TSY4_SULCO|nr:hypothetical protein [Sulfidibacter corallicola]QTD53066.1 hypothetical protein J3U87_11445 [Sulfidibacter corallicola]